MAMGKAQRGGSLGFLLSGQISSRTPARGERESEDEKQAGGECAITGRGIVISRCEEETTHSVTQKQQRHFFSLATELPLCTTAGAVMGV